MSLPHRPRPVTEIVDAAFQLLRRHYWQFVTLMALVHLPWGVVRLAFGDRLDISMNPARMDWTVALLVLAASMLVFAMLEALLLTAASDAYLEEQFDLGSVLRRGVRRMPIAIAATVLKWTIVALYGMIAVVGGSIVVAAVTLATKGGARGAALATFMAVWLGITFVAIAVVALYAMVRTFAVPAAQVLDGAGLWAGLKRSSALSKGLLRHIGGTLALVWGTYFAIVAAINLAAVSLTSPLLAQAISTLLSVLTFPIVVITQAVLYYDVRMRKEGFDIELLTRDLAPLAPTTAPAPPLAPADASGEQPAH